MQNAIISFIKIPATLVSLTRDTDEYSTAVEALESTHPTLFRLLQKNPHCANVGGWFAINDIDDQVENPIIVSDLVDENGNQLEGPALIFALGKLMVSSPGTTIFHCTLGQIVMLTDSVFWKVWSMQIEDIDELKAAHLAIFKDDMDGRWSDEAAPQRCADKIRELF